MKKSHIFFLLSVLSLFFSLRALAELPSTEITQFTQTYDVSSTPASLYIWDNQKKGSGSEAKNVSMVCQSASDTSHGACPVEPKWSAEGNGRIALKFVQDYTTAERDIIVTNKRENGVSSRPVWTAANSQANLAPSFSYFISQADLRNLTGGVWRATLIMNYRDWKVTTSPIATWTANIVLTVGDLNNQQIFFPAFPHAAPMIDLNLTNRPGTKNNATAGGVASMDMCLYDGSNSSSNRINMRFTDEGASTTGREDGLFSVYRTGADKNQTVNRIDYKVSVINPTTGATQAISNGTEISWINTNRRNILRQVVLPGVSGASFCVPAPITLVTPVFKLADKTAGHYSGKLTIIYTPSTQSN